MSWSRAILDPWKIPAYFAGVCAVGFVALMIHMAQIRCDIDCKIDRIIVTLDRIDAKIDVVRARVNAPTETNSCDIQWPLGRPSKERDL